MTPKRLPYLLPHERFLMSRVIKNDAAAAQKRERRGTAATMLDSAASANGLIGLAFDVPAVLLVIPGAIVRGGVIWTAIYLFALSGAAWLVAMVRQVQSIFALLRYRKSRSPEQLT